MTLELKHLAPYVPYKLYIINDFGVKTQFTVGYLNYWVNEKVLIKPILKPLSDLEQFCTNEFHNRMLIRDFSFDEAQKLIADHYDVFGLIEQGLAIDINTLNK